VYKSCLRGLLVYSGEQLNWISAYRQRISHFRLSGRDFADHFPLQNVLFAAGNEARWGKGAGDIGDEPSAKNVITVGACESARQMDIRPNGNYVYDETRPPGDPNKWAKFSSTGPCKNTKRIKPVSISPTGRHIYGFWVFSEKCSYEKPSAPISLSIPQHPRIYTL
jgi:hypothetical protein